jgi:hypothetical protein
MTLRQLLRCGKFLEQGRDELEGQPEIASFISSKFCDINFMSHYLEAYRVAFQNCSLIAQTSVMVIRRDCSRNEPEIESKTI